MDLSSKSDVTDDKSLYKLSQCLAVGVRVPTKGLKRKFVVET